MAEKLETSLVVEEEKKSVENDVMEDEPISEQKLEAFRDCIGLESEVALFAKHKPITRNGKPKKRYNSDIRNAFQKLLSGTYVELEDGTTITVAERLVSLGLAYTIANPTPANIKMISEISGEIGHGGAGNERDKGLGIAVFFNTVRADKAGD